MPRTPNTTYQLLSVNWDSEYKNLRYFGSVTEQNTWFSGKGVSREGNQTVRFGFPYTVRGDYETISKYNYMRFRNNQYSNPKWWYAFIDRVEYASENTCNVYFTMDAYQSYLGDITFEQCYMEREHTEGDSVPWTQEPMGAGDVIYTLAETMYPSGGGFVYLMVTSKLRNEDEEQKGARLIDNFADGLYYYMCNDIQQLNDLIDVFSKVMGSPEDIKAIYGLPSNMVTYTRNAFWQLTSFSIASARAVSRPDKFGDYTPKNKKCFYYPYCYAVASNNQGSTQEYQFEKYDNNAIGFSCDGRLGAVPVLVLMTDPKSKDGTLHDLIISGFPQVSYNSQYFDTYMSRNGMSLATSIFTTGAGLAASAATGGAALPIALAGAGSALSTATQIQQAKMGANPAQMSPSAMPYLATKNRFNFYIFYAMSNENYIRKVDQFFTRFGYCVNAIRKPDPTKRSAFYYVKTDGAVITGNIPMEIRRILTNALDSGVTFWRNNDIGNFTQDNN